MPEPRIPLDQWRALVAVVEKGGYARAAAALHKSQSSVTYGVQQLESQLGVKAFKIAGRRAELTPTGELLYRRARYLLDEAAALEQSAQRLSAGWEAEVRLAVEVIFPTWLLLPCLDRGGALGLWICMAAGRKNPAGAGGRHAEAASHARGRRALRRALPDLRGPGARRPGHAAAGGDHPRGGGERVQAFRLAAENLRAETHQLEFQAARVVKLVDTGDLKSPDPNRSCRFESGPGHQFRDSKH